MQFTIVWSNKCNLSCDYCCVYDSLNKGSVLSVEDAIKFIDWQFSLYPKEEEHTIEFFGGEPTLHMDEIRALMQYTKLNYNNYNISYRIYTNGIFNKRIKNFDDVWSNFDDIICSIDGHYEDNLLRTKNEAAYGLSISNFKHLLNFGTAGIAFVLHPDSNLEKTFNYFKDMGCRYFHLEIASLWNDDKDNGITLDYLFKTCKEIYELILLHNSKPENKEDFILFSIPREFLSPNNFFSKEGRISCFDIMRSLSPKGNIYFCRDLAVSEFHLETISTDDNVFFKQNNDVPFNIKNLQLDKNLNSFSKDSRYYDSITSCPVKSFEFKHLAKITPEWITNLDFQDIVLYPLFEIMNDTFTLYSKNRIEDEKFIKLYNKKISTYGMILDRYEELFL